MIELQEISCAVLVTYKGYTLATTRNMDDATAIGLVAEARRAKIWTYAPIDLATIAGVERILDDNQETPFWDRMSPGERAYVQC